MLLSQMLAVALSMGTTAQARDPVDVARDAFNGCLRTYVNRNIDAHKSVAQIRSGLAEQCASEEAAYRTAMIRSDVAARVAQADAERNATQEITDSRQSAAEQVADPA